jgi:hypothetical protein
MSNISMCGDIGNKCVSCNQDTSFGSGRFVNRIPADGDYESLDEQGNTIFSDGEYRDGFLCPECNRHECCRCDELISTDEDIQPCDVYGKDDKRSRDDFSDGAFRVHLKCLTEQEQKDFDQ